LTVELSEHFADAVTGRAPTIFLAIRANSAEIQK